MPQNTKQVPVAPNVSTLYPDDVRVGYNLHLSQAQNERLVFLVEQCLSVIHGVMKIQRLGYDNEDPMWGDALPTNKQSLINDCGTLLFALNLLAEAGDVGDKDARDLTRALNEAIIAAKTKKLRLFHQDHVLKTLRLESVE